MRARTNIALKERKVFKLDNFRGVDFSASPLDVQSNRAVDMRNFINKNGINCKRNGWRQVLDFGGANINGIHRYSDIDNAEYYIAHVGVNFYKVWVDNGKWYREDEHIPYGTNIDSENTRITNSRSEGYLREHRLYIIGAGDYFVYGTWDEGATYELRRVEDDEDTYIPTTTININSDGESADDVQGTLDEPNLLCKRRKNTLVGTGTQCAFWTLDSAVAPNTKVEVCIEKADQGINEQYETMANDNGNHGNEIYIKNDTSEKPDSRGWIYRESGQIQLYFPTHTIANMDNITVTFTPAEKPSSEQTIRTCVERHTGRTGYEGYYSIILQHTPKDITRIIIAYGCVKNGVSKSAYVRAVIDGSAVKVEKVFGDIADLNSLPKQDDKIGTVKDKTITFEAATQYYEGKELKNNIMIQYTYEVLEDAEQEDEEQEDEEEELVAEDISKCAFGILFGTYGNTDRLFLSGNPDRPNMDFYSAADDYTYFTASQCAVLGSDASAVGGYTRLSDSTLAIFKENADREASIYFRTGKLNEEYDSEGNLEDGSAVFPLTAGALGETIVSRYSCANFAGDNIMLSRNGVHGIVLGENVVLTERHTRERSRAINKRLLAHRDLSEAVGVVFENRYYLAVDGVCYVADTRYKYKRKDDIDGSYNYEWWFLDNIPARIWAVIDGKLYFGTSDGKICVFDDEYTDRTFIETEVGELTLSNDYTNDYTNITYNKALKEGFADGDELEIIGATDGEENPVDVYALYTVDDITKVYEGIELYADSEGFEVDVPYTVSEVDIANNRFTLSKDGVEVAVIYADGEDVFYRRISGERLKVINKDKTEEMFGVALWGDESDTALKVSMYNNTMPGEITARITHKKKIEAEWRTPTFDLGTNMASKTILGITATSDPQFDGNVSIGYDTRFYSGSFDVRGNRVFSFDDFDFLDFSFDTGFATSYTRRLNKRNVNYVSFGFKSTDDRCCAVNSLAVLYKINKNNRGVN